MNGASVITLTTDFGIRDGYVSSVKGVILSINPSVNIIDISHSIKPQNIFQASFILQTVYRYFPGNTIHLVVVDPGVGSRRKALLIQIEDIYFIAPDNGVLSYVIGDYYPPGVYKKSAGDYTLHKITIPENIKAFEITSPEYRLENPSSTFHGRDIFGPAAAYLSRGVAPEKFGKAVRFISVFKPPLPGKNSRGNTTGRVIYVDGFGNLITNIKKENIGGKRFTAEIAGVRISGPGKTYAEKQGLNVLIGSSGYLEIALQNGSASEFLKAGFGAEITLKQE